MTIKDALDRAKRLRKDRLEERPDRGRVAGGACTAETRLHACRADRQQPAITFEPLATVEISAAVASRTESC